MRSHCFIESRAQRGGAAATFKVFRTEHKHFVELAQKAPQFEARRRSGQINSHLSSAPPERNAEGFQFEFDRVGQKRVKAQLAQAAWDGCRGSLQTGRHSLVVINHSSQRALSYL